MGPPRPGRTDVAEQADRRSHRRRRAGCSLASRVPGLSDVVPRYMYWPTVDPDAGPTTPSRFADGGILENLAIATALSYGDVDNVIAFVNTNQPMTLVDGVVSVDDSIPAALRLPALRSDSRGTVSTRPPGRSSNPRTPS